MARKTYSLSFGGATTGDASVAGKPIGWDTDAAGFEGALNAFTPAGGFGGWTVTGGSGSFTVEQPEECGNYDLSANVLQNTLDASPSCTITQQWTPTVNLSVDDNTISEPSGVAVVAFAIAAVHTQAITVAFAISGSATIDVDYTTSTTSPVTIASGESTATLTVSVVDDAAFESDETVAVYLGSITNGEAGTSSIVTITISSDDSAGATMIVHAPTGLTLTAKVFERGSDTLVETVTLTERTNCKGVYEGDLAENESGWHDVSIFSGATCVGIQVAYLTTNPVEHYAGDYCGIEDPSGLLATVGPSATSIRNAVGLASANLDTQLNGTATTATAIKTKTDLLPTVAAGLSGGVLIGSGTGTVTLTSGGVVRANDANGAAIPTAASIVSAWGSGTTANTSLARDRVLEAIAGACCAVIAGAGTTTNSVKHLNSTAANLTITVDTSGNRSAVTIS